MIKRYTAQKLNKELKAIASRFEDDFRVSRQASEDAYKKNMKPGQVFHSRPGFYSDEDSKRFAESSEKYKAEAHQLLDEVALTVQDQITRAPSTDAVNSIMLLSNRKDVSSDEIDMLMNKYGKDCPQAYKALREIAESHGYYDFVEDPVSRQAENIMILANSIDRSFDASKAASSGTVAQVAGFCANVDQAFPVES